MPLNPILAQSAPSLSDLRAAMACIPVGIRSRLAALIVNEAKHGGAPEVIVGRVLAHLDGRILRSARKHQSDHEAEIIADQLERHPEVARLIARWALTWAREAVA